MTRETQPRLMGMRALPRSRNDLCCSRLPRGRIAVRMASRVLCVPRGLEAGQGRGARIFSMLSTFCFCISSSSWSNDCLRFRFLLLRVFHHVFNASLVLSASARVLAM